MSTVCVADNGRCLKDAIKQVEYQHNGIVYTRFLCPVHYAAFGNLRGSVEVTYDGELRDKIQPPPPASAPAPAQADQVYVITRKNGQAVQLLGVTRNPRDAKLWKLGNPQTNDYTKFALDYMPWDEADEEETAEKEADER